jgi:hypothetical protein
MRENPIARDVHSSVRPYPSLFTMQYKRAEAKIIYAFHAFKKFQSFKPLPSSSPAPRGRTEVGAGTF